MSSFLGCYPFKNTWFANVFSQSVGFLFNFLTVSFAVKKVFSLMESHLFILLFFVVRLKIWPPWIVARSLMPMFSSSFMVPMFYVQVTIFLCGVKRWSSFILLHVAVQLSQNHLLTRLFYPHCIFLAHCCKLIKHKCMGLLLSSLFCSIYFVSVFCQYHNVLLIKDL